MTTRRIHGIPVRGIAIDPETRCTHYDGERDIIALRFGCCERYHPCYQCHEAVTDHDAEPWPQDRFDEPAVLCGSCGTELTVGKYRDCEHSCPNCAAQFNPDCATHEHYYFE